jgi:hypothetical protein
MLASSPAFRYAGNRGEASGAWRRAMPADAGHPMLASLAGWISSLRLLTGHRIANGQRAIHGRRVVGFWLAPVVDFLLAPKGWLLVAKKLERGRFPMPWQRAPTQGQVWALQPGELSLLLEGIDLRGAKRLTRWQPTPYTTT